MFPVTSTTSHWRETLRCVRQPARTNNQYWQQQQWHEQTVPVRVPFFHHRRKKALGRFDPASPETLTPRCRWAYNLPQHPDTECPRAHQGSFSLSVFRRALNEGLPLLAGRLRFPTLPWDER